MFLWSGFLVGIRYTNPQKRDYAWKKWKFYLTFYSMFLFRKSLLFLHRRHIFGVYFGISVGIFAHGVRDNCETHRLFGLYFTEERYLTFEYNLNNTFFTHALMEDGSTVFFPVAFSLGEINLVTVQNMFLSLALLSALLCASHLVLLQASMDRKTCFVLLLQVLAALFAVFLFQLDFLLNL